VHPFYTAAVREFESAGRTVVASGPVGVEGTAAWLEAIGRAAGVSEADIASAKQAALPAIEATVAKHRIAGRVTVSGYEGSELLVARLLIEAGADVPYVGTACPRTPWSAPDKEWLEARGTVVQYRASLEQDVAAVRAFEPDLAIGTTPVVQAAKERGTPGVYFTNLISARPLFGAPGAGALAATVNGAIGGAVRLNRMRSFFSGVGTGAGAGYGHTEVPVERAVTSWKPAVKKAKDDGTMTDIGEK
jgi:chlorophyllide a reductase subunit Y